MASTQESLKLKGLIPPEGPKFFGSPKTTKNAISGTFGRKFVKNYLRGGEGLTLPRVSPDPSWQV